MCQNGTHMHTKTGIERSKLLVNPRKIAEAFGMYEYEQSHPKRTIIRHDDLGGVLRLYNYDGVFENPNEQELITLSNEIGGSRIE